MSTTLELQTEQNEATDQAASSPIEPILVDGLWVDPETGEVVGVKSDDLSFDQMPESGWTFDHANWIMERALRRESMHRGADIRLQRVKEELDQLIEEHMRELETDPKFIELQSRIDQLETLSAGAAKSRDSIIERFRHVLHDFAASKVTTKSKTVKLEFGNLQIVKSPDKTEIFDEEKAIEYLLVNNHGDAIKRSVLISKVPADEIEQASADENSGIRTIAGTEQLKVKFV